MRSSHLTSQSRDIRTLSQLILVPTTARSSATPATPTQHLPLPLSASSSPLYTLSVLFSVICPAYKSVIVYCIVRYASVLTLVCVTRSARSDGKVGTEVMGNSKHKKCSHDTSASEVHLAVGQGRLEFL